MCLQFASFGSRESVRSFVEPQVWWIWLFHSKKHAPSMDDIAEDRVIHMSSTLSSPTTPQKIAALSNHSCCCTQKFLVLDGSTLSNHSWKMICLLPTYMTITPNWVVDSLCCVQNLCLSKMKKPACCHPWCTCCSRGDYYVPLLSLYFTFLFCFMHHTWLSSGVRIFGAQGDGLSMQ